MGLLMSDTMLIEPTLNDTLTPLDNRYELAYVSDPARDAHADAGAELAA